MININEFPTIKDETKTVNIRRGDQVMTFDLKPLDAQQSEDMHDIFPELPVLSFKGEKAKRILAKNDHNRTLRIYACVCKALSVSVDWGTEAIRKQVDICMEKFHFQEVMHMWALINESTIVTQAELEEREEELSPPLSPMKTGDSSLTAPNPPLNSTPEKLMMEQEQG